MHGLFGFVNVKTFEPDFSASNFKVLQVQKDTTERSSITAKFRQRRSIGAAAWRRFL
jgi:hypothetical protein